MVWGPDNGRDGRNIAHAAIHETAWNAQSITPRVSSIDYAGLFLSLKYGPVTQYAEMEQGHRKPPHSVCIQACQCPTFSNVVTSLRASTYRPML